MVDVDDPESRPSPAPRYRRRPRRRRLPDLHLGHHRGAQGCGGHPPQRHPTVDVVGPGLPRPGVWSQWHSFAFDVSVWEIFGALLHGGRLVVVPEAVGPQRKTSTGCWPPNTLPC
ncbi:putative linear gramicidin synthetase subunit D [Mycobacterium xenopi 4042]|uniref:Putative linear gramicidin synthetase subunit D n=1 Tax=Mycobacterium xenopi 4042 TaxID=1299334 RepID=X8ANP0_MYCXE|nr:putative linear gramicidin synthetase subunit D [Mycobacterium xenopi 4042]